ncbi:hypothetical protein AN642_01185 [Epulopiscium sp. SCG-B10WGA-EpuloA2]|nr:hypothetical protein AN642_01185 [Epulopiscium sp. SCG-B10WGA-EpuloA2]
MDKLLKDGAKQLGINLTDLQIEQLLEYKNLLLEWNKKLNLTAITKEEEIITKHFLDSLSVGYAINLDQYKNLIDVGTGAASHPACPPPITIASTLSAI